MFGKTMKTFANKKDPLVKWASRLASVILSNDSTAS